MYSPYFSNIHQKSCYTQCVYENIYEFVARIMIYGENTSKGPRPAMVTCEKYLQSVSTERHCGPQHTSGSLLNNKESSPVP